MSQLLHLYDKRVNGALITSHPCRLTQRYWPSGRKDLGFGSDLELELEEGQLLRLQEDMRMSWRVDFAAFQEVA